MKKYSQDIFLFGLTIMAIGMPLSVFLMSISQFIMAAGWLAQGDFRNRLNNFLKNPVAISLSLIILLHLIGLLWTSDFKYGFKDVKTKLPIFIIPFLCSSFNFNNYKFIKRILIVFIGAVLTGTFISTGIWLQLWGKPIHDIREISIFISHIRFALLICMSIFVCGHYFNHSINKTHKMLYGFAIAWFICFLFILGSVTGLVILLTTSLFLVIVNLYKAKGTLFRIALLAIPLLLCFGTYLYIQTQYNTFKKTDRVDLTKLPEKTINGNLYNHEAHNLQRENGHYVYLYICKKELRKHWSQLSNIDIDSLDHAKQPIYATVIRYLTSRNLTKDSMGLSKLSAQEIKYIEDGIANKDYVNNDLHSRLHQIFWEVEVYKLGKAPDGNSVTMRLEFWKTALLIIKDHPVIGVGTGDIVNAFKSKYIESKSILSEKWRLRSHNQYLSIGVAFGIAGIMFFISCLLFPVLRLGKYFMFLAFYSILIISMITEDTIESQAGVTFFAFFFGVFILQERSEKVFTASKETITS